MRWFPVCKNWLLLRMSFQCGLHTDLVSRSNDRHARLHKSCCESVSRMVLSCRLLLPFHAWTAWGLWPHTSRSTGGC